jgi:hypothetical protein
LRIRVLLVWALRFVTVFAPDILAARDQRRPTQSEPSGSPRRRWRSQNVYQHLQALLDDHVRRGEPLPGWQGRPSKYQIAELVECSPKSLNAYWDAVTDAAGIVGAKEAPPLACEVTGQLDGRPWTETITVGQRALYDVGRLSRMLHIACFIVIAYLSGMRDSEIKHLRRGSLRIEYDAEGHPYRWKVSSLAFKGEDDIEGIPATWNVGEPVAQVIMLLEQLQPDGANLLFACLDAPDSNPHSAEQAVANGVTNKHLNAFITWINRYCTQHGRQDFVPAVGGRPWRLKTSQFRRTLAWFIARRPGGTIAGALQYRHHTIQMFEGYAGTSDSGFRAEVESEQALARGEHYTSMIDAHEHTALTGPAAEEATRRLTDFGERARFQGVVVLDEQRLKRLMKRHDPAIYPGEFITCVHDHGKAQCVKAQRGRSEQLPDHGGCKPLACRNVALTEANIAAWTRVVDRIDRRLRTHPALPPLLEHRLRGRRQEILDFLDRNAPHRAAS